MKRTDVLCFLFVFTFTLIVTAQRKEINGQLISTEDVEGIHILNTTAAKYAISDQNGKFVIIAKALDTLYITGLKYESQTFVISNAIEESGTFNVQLIEKINELNEVLVGSQLTGSLESDVENSKAKPKINFYDLGIPGNTDLPLTQNQQRLNDADNGKFVYYYGIGLAINVHKILNRINGDTKDYKERVEIEFKEKCLKSLKSEYSEIIFEAIPIPEESYEAFFQFCLHDSSFKSKCEEAHKLNAVNFLLEKLKIYKAILNEED